MAQSSPNPLAIRSFIASIASASSGPSASMTSVLPLAAASIITPMMLLALIRREPFDSQTSDLNFEAVAVSLADGLACSPSRFTTTASALSIGPGILLGAGAGAPAAFGRGSGHADRVPGAVDQQLAEIAHRHLPVGDRLDQHRQVDTGQHAHAAGDGQPHRHARRRRAE